MPGKSERNAEIFNTIIDGGLVSHVSNELGLTPTTVRRIFLRECLKRSPDGYAEGVLNSNGTDPTVVWLQSNAKRFKEGAGARGIQNEEIETFRAIRMLESRGYAVKGKRPFSLATPLHEFAALTPRQKEYLTRKGILTLGDAAKLDSEELERVSDSPRQLDIIKHLLDLAR